MGRLYAGVWHMVAAKAFRKGNWSCQSLRQESGEEKGEKSES